MKILILAAPRVGARNLGIWLSKELNYTLIDEPFHFHLQSSIKNDNQLYDALMQDNIIVKVNYGDWNQMFTTNEFFSFFDKKISITRKDVFDSAISFTKAQQTNNFINSYNIDEEWVEKNFVDIFLNKNFLGDISDKIKKIKNFLQITYEGIYFEGNDVNKIQTYLELNQFNHLYHLKNDLKYRIKKVI